MKLGETDPTVRRIGPIQASVLDALEVKVNDGSFGAAGGTVIAIGGTAGYVYYQATADDASVRGFIEVKLVGAAEVAIREEVEIEPQGIPAGTTDASLLVAGSLRLVDGGGAALVSLVGVDVEVSINGSDWAPPSGDGELVLTDDGYADYLIDRSEATRRGWVAVKASGACQEVVFRVDIVRGASPAISLTPSAAVATSSAEARASGDLALVWSNAYGNADLSLFAIDAAGDAMDLESDKGLTTAALLSLFLDRRAEDDDVPPSGDPNDRRGWWADQFLEVKGDKYGSRLWLLDRSKTTRETELKAEEYVREALAWMIEDRVVSSIDFEVETRKPALLFAVGLQRPGRDPVTFKFRHVWDAMEAA